jgi:hypothetical protein
MVQGNVSQPVYAEYLRRAILNQFPHPSLVMTEPDFGYWPDEWGDVYTSDIVFGNNTYTLQLGWSPNDAEKLPHWSLHRSSVKEECQYDSDLKCILHSLVHSEESWGDSFQDKIPVLPGQSFPRSRSSSHAKLLASHVVQRIITDLAERAVG